MSDRLPSYENESPAVSGPEDISDEELKVIERILYTRDNDFIELVSDSDYTLTEVEMAFLDKLEIARNWTTAVKMARVPTKNPKAFGAYVFRKPAAKQYIDMMRRQTRISHIYDRKWYIDNALLIYEQCFEFGKFKEAIAALQMAFVMTGLKEQPATPDENADFSKLDSHHLGSIVHDMIAKKGGQISFEQALKAAVPEGVTVQDVDWSNPDEVLEKVFTPQKRERGIVTGQERMVNAMVRHQNGEDFVVGSLKDDRHND